MHYLAKRHLGMDPEEFEALPWHRRRLYENGLTWEFVKRQEGEPTPDEIPGEEDDTEDDDVSSLGVTVRRSNQ